ncbi:MAG: type IV toxin-antitoxin system AbiEi family antitoxin [Proteobacteria bacterium]|nr:type IV toxin-antitoxin system AbiEi family antitoxin [Pseudomonadota bacterium]
MSDAMATVLGINPTELSELSDKPLGADFAIAALGQTFVAKYSKSTSAALIADAAKKVRGLAQQHSPRTLPLLVVPFMGDVGRRLCDEMNVGWLDLSGNARIFAPGIRILVDGHPNRFRPVGRPHNTFAPKSARVARWLLTQPNQSFTQRQIARATDMTEGYVSRIVTRLEREGYLARDGKGAVRPKDPALLLDAWRDAYQFSKHTLLQGHVAARSGDALLRLVADTLSVQGIDYAATGLAAAWVMTHFAAFRIATFYLSAAPPSALLTQLGFREDPRGANLWFVVPNDAGVFQGASDEDGIRCVHPVQVYIDLKAHPERASEAAEQLRAQRLSAGLFKR